MNLLRKEGKHCETKSNFLLPVSLTPEKKFVVPTFSILTIPTHHKKQSRIFKQWSRIFPRKQTTVRKFLVLFSVYKGPKSCLINTKVYLMVYKLLLWEVLRSGSRLVSFLIPGPRPQAHQDSGPTDYTRNSYSPGLLCPHFTYKSAPA